MKLVSPIDAVICCPACRGPAHCVFSDLYDDRYGYPDVFTLYECERCGHMHIPTNFRPEDLGRLYTDYYPRGNFDIQSFRPEQEAGGLVSWLKGEHAAAFRRVPHNVRVLDIGCGIGATLAYHKARGCEAVGIEADENVQAIAKHYGLDIRAGIFDGTQFDSNYFDFVTLDQVAEHVTDPHALMRGVARVLKPGGKTVITTPNPKGLGARLFGRKWLNWHVPYHIQFYTRRSLARIAEEAGLRLRSSETTTASEWQFYQWVHIRQFPKRGERSAFWSPGMVEPKPSKWIDDWIAKGHRHHLQRPISRVLDAFGLGDNQVFVLEKP
jgi:2-polyprenyl-3-methyl-5-hydroxy-6-metoxy-1,4-benzoquinol methylase